MSKMEGLLRIDVDTLNAGGFAVDVLNMALHWGILVPVETVEAEFDGSPQPFGSNWPEPGRYLLVKLEDSE